MTKQLANIEGEEIVVRIPLDALPLAASVAWDEHYGFEQHNLVVEDVQAFAKEFVFELNRENEVGDTLLHFAFDKAAFNVAENGGLGIGEGSQ